MGYDDAIVAGIGLGFNLYDLFDKLTQKDKYDPRIEDIYQNVQWIKDNLIDLWTNIRNALTGAIGEIEADIRLQELSKLPAAHSAVVDYGKTHSNPPTPPQLNDPNYIDARGRTSEVLSYFMGHKEVDFFPGFIYATNARIEFITKTDPCWFKNTPQYLTDIRDSINHLNDYISLIRSNIDQHFTVQSTTNYAYDPPEGSGKPQKVAVSVLLMVADPSGHILWSKRYGIDSSSIGESDAWKQRSYYSSAKQDQWAQPYNQIAAGWNSLITSSAPTAVKRALLPSAAATPVGAALRSLEVTALREVKTTSLTQVDEAAAPGNPRPDLELPLRNLLLDILSSAEFQAEHDLSLQGNDRRPVNLWFRRAVQREPTEEETVTLQSVLRLFGHRSFFYCLGYSREYERLWGDGVPSPSVAINTSEST